MTNAPDQQTSSWPQARPQLSDRDPSSDITVQSAPCRCFGINATPSTSCPKLFAYNVVQLRPSRNLRRVGVPCLLPAARVRTPPPRGSCESPSMRNIGKSQNRKVGMSYRDHQAIRSRRFFSPDPLHQSGLWQQGRRAHLNVPPLHFQEAPHALHQPFMLRSVVDVVLSLCPGITVKPLCNPVLSLCGPEARHQLSELIVRAARSSMQRILRSKQKIAPNGCACFKLFGWR